MVGTETCCSDTFFWEATPPGTQTEARHSCPQTHLSTISFLTHLVLNGFFFYTFLILLQWCHRVAVSTPALHLCFTQRVLVFTIPNGASSGGLGIAKTHCGFFFFNTRKCDEKQLDTSAASLQVAPSWSTHHSSKVAPNPCWTTAWSRCPATESLPYGVYSIILNGVSVCYNVVYQQLLQWRHLWVMWSVDWWPTTAPRNISPGSNEWLQWTIILYHNQKILDNVL